MMAPNMILLTVSVMLLAILYTKAESPFVQSGRLFHRSGLCVHPQGGGHNPADNKKIVFHECETDGANNYARINWGLTKHGHVVHVSSGKCLHTLGASHADNTNVVLYTGECWPETSPRLDIRWSTVFGTVDHVSQKCWHPRGGTASLDNDIVIYHGCRPIEDKLKFSFDYADVGIWSYPSGVDGYETAKGDCPGNDIWSIYKKYSNLAECASRCKSTPSCAGFMLYNNHECYPKTKTCDTPSTANPLNVFYRPTSRGPWQPSSVDGYETAKGDCPGNDIWSIYKKYSNLAECASRCKSTSSCAGFMLYNNHECYPKTKTCDTPSTANPLNVFYRPGSGSTGPSVRTAVDPQYVAFGRLKHSGGRCVHPVGGAYYPGDNTRLVLHDCNSDKDRNYARITFGLTSTGHIIHVSSGKCVHPLGGSTNPGDPTELVLYGGDCWKTSNQAIVWSLSSGKSIKQNSSGKCWHPEGGAVTPALDTKVVVHTGCDLDRLAFTFV